MLRETSLKLTVFLIIFMFFVSCSKKDDDTKSASAFAPPSWMQGAWVDNVSSSSKYGWKFDSSDKYMVIFGLLSGGYVAAGITITELTNTESEFSYSWVTTGTSGGTDFSGTVEHVFTKGTSSTIVLTGTSTTSNYTVTEGTYTKDTSL
jgi:hypothetical protein